MSSLKQSKKIYQYLDAHKAEDIKTYQLRQDQYAEFLIIATARSSTHVRAMAQEILKDLKHSAFSLLGYEGFKAGEWALIDLGNIVIHIMLGASRDFYQLDKLANWDFNAH